MTYLPPRVRAKNAIKKVVPQKVFDVILNLWRRTGAKLIRYRDILPRYQSEFLSIHGYNVVDGPFKGLRYVKQAVGSSYLLKLIGAYEEVLHGTVDKLKRRDYKTIIDIGCAEGYYLIGLGMYNKNATLIGYDLEEDALTLAKELAEKNNLPNTLILEKDCTYEKLNTIITDNTLLICDAEGFEGTILDPEKATSLKTTQTLLVELHDFAYPNIKNILMQRFSPTHTIETITFKQATAEKYPFLNNMENKLDRYYLLYERLIQDQEWLVMEKK